MVIPSEQDINLDLIEQQLIVVYANQYDNDNPSNDDIAWIEEHPIGTSITIQYRDSKTPVESCSPETLNIIYPNVEDYDFEETEVLYLNTLNGMVYRLWGVADLHSYVPGSGDIVTKELSWEYLYALTSIKNIGNVINCHIYNNGVTYNLSDYSLSHIVLELKRSNGTCYTNSINGLGGNVSGNIITFPITSEMTADYGRNEINFRLENEEDIKYTSRFYMRVYKDPVQQSEIATSNEFKDIKEDIAEIEARVRLLSNEYVTATSTPPQEAHDNDWWTELID